MNAPAKNQSRKLTPQDIPAYLQTDSGQAKIRQYAPEDVTDEQIKRTGLWLLNNGPEDLEKCDVGQIIEAILQSFHDGIDLTRGEGHIVPYPPTVDYRIDYKGLVRLAEEGTDVRVGAEVVREDESIDLRRDADGLHFEHQMDPFGGGEPIGVYCIVSDSNGIRKVETMRKSELEKIAEQSGSRYNDKWSPAWKQYFWEMSKKSVTRRALKTVDTRPAVDRVLTREQRQTFDDEQVDGQKTGGDLNTAFEPDDNVEQLPQGQSGTAQQADQQAQRETVPAQQHDQSQRQQQTVHEGAQQQVADAEGDGGESRDLSYYRRSWSQTLSSVDAPDELVEQYRQQVKHDGTYDDLALMEAERHDLKTADDRERYIRQQVGDSDGWTLTDFRDASDHAATFVDKLEGYCTNDDEIRRCVEYFAAKQDAEPMGLIGSNNLRVMAGASDQRILDLTEEAAGEMPDFDDPTQ